MSNAFTKKEIALYCIGGYFCECLISAYLCGFIKRAEIKIAEYFNQLSLHLLYVTLTIRIIFHICHHSNDNCYHMLLIHYLFSTPTQSDNYITLQYLILF